MKKGIISCLTLGVCVLTLTSCSSENESGPAEIKDASGNTIEVTKTEDTKTVSTVISALNSKESDTSNIKSIMVESSNKSNVKISGTESMSGVCDLSEKQYISLQEDSTSILKHDVWLNVSGNVEITDEKINIKQDNVSAKVFTNGGNVYFSYKNLDLSSLDLPLELPKEAKYSISNEYLNTLLETQDINISEFSSYIKEFDPSFMNEYIKTICTSYKTGTYDLCSDLSITITDTSKDEVEFCADTTVSNVIDVAKSYIKTQDIDFDVDSFDELDEMFGSMGLILTYRVNTTTLLPTKIGIVTKNFKPYYKNDNGYIVNIENCDINTISYISYNQSKPEEDTSEYLLFA